MSSAPKTIPHKFLVPLNVNGLKGRMLCMPPPKNIKRDLLVIYGHHSSLERVFSLAQVLNDYTGVTMPDLPGFGGMDDFYKIGEKPDLDTMADYLASIIKLHYRRRRFSVAGISYGFLVVTRMLQRYPELASRVDMLVSVAGFTHHEDLKFKRSRLLFYRLAASLFKHRLTAYLFRNIFLHPFILRHFYSRTHNAKDKFSGLAESEKKSLTEFEIKLWRLNDVRTYMATTLTMLSVNNCESQVNLPVWHVGVKADNYFDNSIIEQHMRIIFNDYMLHWAPIKTHMPNLIADKSEVARLLPKSVLKALAAKS